MALGGSLSTYWRFKMLNLKSTALSVIIIELPQVDRFVDDKPIIELFRRRRKHLTQRQMRGLYKRRWRTHQSTYTEGHMGLQD